MVEAASGFKCAEPRQRDDGGRAEGHLQIDVAAAVAVYPAKNGWTAKRFQPPSSGVRPARQAKNQRLTAPYMGWLWEFISGFFFSSKRSQTVVASFWIMKPMEGYSSRVSSVQASST